MSAFVLGTDHIDYLVSAAVECGITGHGIPWEGERIEWHNADAVGAVIDRLNRAAGSWEFTIVSTSLETTPVSRKGETVNTPVWIVTAALEIPGLGSRQAIGVAVAEGTGDSIKSASSDALKRCAALFGVQIDGGA